MCRREGTGQLSNDGVVFALDMKTGTLLWNITGAGGVPIFLPQSNAVIVAGENGTVFAADATTGRVLWEQQGILPLARFMGPFVHDPQRGKYISNYRHTGVIYNKLQTHGSYLQRFWSFRSTELPPSVTACINTKLKWCNFLS